MRYTIQNLEDITDSREIMEARPHRFGMIFTYILIALLLTALTWSYFGEKEIVVKVSGTVRPYEEVSSVSTNAAGQVIEVKVKDGDIVRNGDILYAIDHGDLSTQKDNYTKSLDLKEKQLSNWQLLIKAINDNKNYFNNNVPDEVEFYNDYINYEQSIKDSNNQKDTSQRQLKYLRDTLDILNKYKKCIQDNNNYFDNKSSYYYQFLEYQYNLDSLNVKLDNAKKLKDSLVSSKAGDDQIQQAQASIDSCSKDIDNLKNSTLANTQLSIEQTQSKINESTGCDDNTVSIEKLKTSAIANANSSINALKDSIADLSLNIDSLNKKIEACAIKATSDGVINLIDKVSVGDFVQSGAELARIVPGNASKYKLDIYISNSDIGNIRNGQDIKLNFLSLPQSDYGTIDTKLENLSADVKIDSRQGTSYYNAEAVISQTSVANRKGEKAEIKPGMAFEASVVSRREKYLYYFLEKINLKD